jgi:hypothetical protein
MKHIYSKVLLLLLITLFSSMTHAGFLAGVVVGSMSGTTTKTEQSAVVFSETADVISCSSQGADCMVPLNHAHKFKTRFVSPSEYAALFGYRKVKRIGQTISGIHVYLVMEVE